MSLGKFEPLYSSKPFPRQHVHPAEDFDMKSSPGSHAFANGYTSSSSSKHLEHATMGSDGGKKSHHALNLSSESLKSYIHIETHPNGGASVVRVYESEIASLSPTEKEKLVKLFFEEVFSEEPENVAKHVIGIVHGAAAYMPELVNHMALTRPDLDVKVCFC